MGDMADYHTEQGEEVLLAHNTGQCDGYCPYCVEEAKKKRKKKNVKQKK